MTKAMQAKIDQLFRQRDQLLLSNMDWTRLTKEVDPDGVNYQTIRRIERGGTPYGRTLRILEHALRLEEDRQRDRNKHPQRFAEPMAAAQPQPG